MTRACCCALAVLIGVGIGSGVAKAQGVPQVYGNGPPPLNSVPYPVGSGAAGPYGEYCPPDGMGYAAGAAGGAAAAQGLGRQVIFDGVYFRAEYLHWDTQSPGNVLLGAPILGNSDPSVPFIVLDAGGAPLGSAIVPSTRPFQLDGNNGFRGTLGADFINGGTMELGAFVLNPTTSSFTYGNLIPQNQLVGTSTLVDGLLSNNIEFYNDTYQATYRSQLWGAEGNFLFDFDRTGLIEFRPLLGFRYISLDEKLHQRGVFTDQILTLSTVTDIVSTTYNNLYGPQAGFRTEVVTKYFALGVEPKFGVAANSMIARVRTNHFRSISDPDVITQQSFTGVSPFFEVGAYARINITKSIALRAGYNLMWLARITRPEDNIYYNDNGPLPTLPDVVVSATRHDIIIQGLTVGGEFRF